MNFLIAVLTNYNHVSDLKQDTLIIFTVMEVSIQKWILMSVFCFFFLEFLRHSASRNSPRSMVHGSISILKATSVGPRPNYAAVSLLSVLLPPHATVWLCLHLHPTCMIQTMFPSQGQLIDNRNSICNFNFPLPCYKYIPGLRNLDTTIFLRVALFSLPPL